VAPTASSAGSASALGKGADVLPVLAEHDPGRRVRALLVELNPILSRRARATAAVLGLAGVEVRTADAGTTDTYLDMPPADVLVAFGVFGNISVDDMRRTVATLPALLAAGAIVIWTRADRHTGHDPSLDVRTCLLNNGFTEMSLTSTTDDLFRVGIHRLADVHVVQQGMRMFTFV